MQQCAEHILSNFQPEKLVGGNLTHLATRFNLISSAENSGYR